MLATHVQFYLIKRSCCRNEITRMVCQLVDKQQTKEPPALFNGGWRLRSMDLCLSPAVKPCIFGMSWYKLTCLSHDLNPRRQLSVHSLEIYCQLIFKLKSQKNVQLSHQFLHKNKHVCSKVLNYSLQRALAQNLNKIKLQVFIFHK